MPKTCIVIPCYNEERRLPASEFEAFLQSNPSVAFCFVNDGSSDGTLSLLQRIRAEGQGRVQVVDLPRNAGKAEAVRAGVLGSIQWDKFHYIGYFDADLAVPLSSISLLSEVFDSRDSCAMAFGSRVKRLGAAIDRSALRHYIGRIFATAASLLLHLPVYDTQCGAKLFKAGLAAEVFAEPFITRWLFDVEIFARVIKRYGHEGALNMLVEIPLNRWEEKGASKVRMSHIVKVPFDLMAIYVSIMMRGATGPKGRTFRKEQT